MIVIDQILFQGGGKKREKGKRIQMNKNVEQETRTLKNGQRIIQNKQRSVKQKKFDTMIFLIIIFSGLLYLSFIFLMIQSNVKHRQ